MSEEKQTGFEMGESLELSSHPKAKTGALEIGQRGLQLSSLDDAWRFCSAIAASGLAPKGMDTPQKILYALELGYEVGLPPLAALQSIAVINGRASLYGDVMIGLCQASGKFDDEAFEENFEYGDDGLCSKVTCTVRRLPKGKPIVREFTWEEAKAAGLAGKDTYKQYRKRMMQMRARGFALRDGFADVLRGIISREEAMDLLPEKVVGSSSTVPAKPTNLAQMTETLTAAEPISDVAVPAAQETTAEQPTSAETPAAKAKTTKKEKTESAQPKATPVATAPAMPPPKPIVPPVAEQAPAVEAAPEPTVADDGADDLPELPPAKPANTKEMSGVVFDLDNLHAKSDEDLHTPEQRKRVEFLTSKIGSGVSAAKLAEKRLKGDIDKFSKDTMAKYAQMFENFLTQSGVKFDE